MRLFRLLFFFPPLLVLTASSFCYGMVQIGRNQRLSKLNISKLLVKSIVLASPRSPIMPVEYNPIYILLGVLGYYLYYFGVIGIN